MTQVVLGDDLGSDTLLYTGLRLDYCNLPCFKDTGFRLYSAAEAFYYPAFSKPSKNPLDDVRGSVGVGIHYRITPMLNIGLHYNLANFNSKVGDIENQSYISFTLNLF